ncbi:MAG: DUF5069 domain-containing protein [Candidatus Tyrphobacter sp.]
MEPLDLTKHPPRSPSVRLAGLIMLPRTIDKLRASLPGGNVGPYYIRGFSAIMLEQLGIEESALRDAVANAKTDDEVADWVRAHSDPSKYDEINAFLRKRRIADRVDDPDFMARYPSITALSLPHEMPLIDMLEHDDRFMFESR